MVKGYLSQGKVLPFAKHINMSRLFLCNLLSYRRLARWWEYGGNGLFSYVLLYTVGVWDEVLNTDCGRVACMVFLQKMQNRSQGIAYFKKNIITFAPEKRAYF